MSLSPVTVALAVGVLALALPVAAAGSVLIAQHRLAGATDAAALAAADAASGWITEEPCELAARVLRSAGAELESCRVDTERGHARVLAGLASPLRRLHARAHAGPPPAMSPLGSPHDSGEG